jgi:hypothetical protein
MMEIIFEMIGAIKLILFNYSAWRGSTASMGLGVVG